ncbi:hypothetical protein GDQ58_06935 [Salmonella enterica subsp. diarizonae]|nr:hypothetical protein [Salmonella enterica subsp. diarizonae]
MLDATLITLILIGCASIAFFIAVGFSLKPAGYSLNSMPLAKTRGSKSDLSLAPTKEEVNKMQDENEMKFKTPERHPYYGDDLRNIFIEIKDKYSPCGDLLFRLDHLTAVKRTGPQAYFSVLYIKNDTYEGNVPYDAFMSYLKRKFTAISIQPIESGMPVIFTFTVTKEMATSKIRLPPED